MTDTVLCVLIGLPGAGKTSLSNILKQECNSSFEVIPISFDEYFNIEQQKHLISTLNSDKGLLNSDKGLFKNIRTSYYEIVREILISKRDFSYPNKKYTFLENIDLLTKNHIIILDDNFYYRSMRYQYYRLAAEFSCGFCQLYINCEKELAIIRNQNRLAKVEDAAILVMNKKLESPTRINHWEKESLIINPNDFKKQLPAILKLFVHNLENKLSPIEDKTEKMKEAQLICLRNLYHQADLCLRTLVSENIKQYKSNPSKQLNIKEYSAKLNSVKKEILNKIRNGDLVIANLNSEGEFVEQEGKAFLKLQLESMCNN